MPSSIVNDPKHWLDRAQEMRRLADYARDDASKQTMLRIAEDYERLAERVEERRASMGLPAAERG
jgi:hypothetical protein